MHIEILQSVEALKKEASRWDALWERSAYSLPTLRADLLILWLEKFAPQADISLLTIRSGEKYVAAFPLIRHRIGRMLSCGSIPTSIWAPCGDILCDESLGSAPLAMLAESLKQLPWPILWLECAARDQRRWQWFETALDQAGLAWQPNPSFVVDSIPVQKDWEAMTRGWSKNHRKKMARVSKRFIETSSMKLRLITHPEPDAIPGLMHQAFVIEQSGWKGAKGSAILQARGMADFYITQAQTLAKQGHLALAFLEHEGKPIAFEYGWITKRIYHSFKVGYDSQFAKLGPGQILIHELLRSFSAQGGVDHFDCLGPTTASTRKWGGHQYAIDRMMIALPRRVGSLALMTYRHAWPWIRQFRARDEKSTNKANR